MKPRGLTNARKAALRGMAAGAAVVGAVLLIARKSPAGRALRRSGTRLAQRLRYARGRVKGIAYNVTGRSPDPTVADDVLADRVRSNLGRLEKRLDIPHVRVQVRDHVVALHGDVASKADIPAIEYVTRSTAGVRGIESYLHVGLPAGSTRPSAGRAQFDSAPSPALRRLVAAARDAGAARGQERSAVRSVLAMFADRIPDGERRHLLGHLPDDVRELATPPRRHGTYGPRVRTVTELVASTSVEGSMDEQHAETIAEGVLGCLRGLVPDEAKDVAAVLPIELRRFWTSAVPT